MLPQGLHHQIATIRAEAASLARSARRPQCDARISTEKAIQADQLAAQADQLTEHATGNDQTMEGITHLINYLARSPHQSRYRSLCITALEQAHSWLLRENGNPVAAAKLVPVPPLPTTH